MKKSSLRTSALIGLMLSLPFAVHEFAFHAFVRPGSRIDADSKFVVGLAVLFGFLWVIPFLAAAIGQRLVGEIATEPRLLVPRVVAKVAVVMGLALLWGALVVDQMPCFLAVPNCD